MGLFDALIPSLASVAGALTNRKKTITNTSQTNVPEDLQPLRSQIIGQTTNLLNTDPNLQGYEAGQIGEINHASELQRQNLEDELGQRGITKDSPAYAAAIANLDSQRFGSIVKLKQQTPLNALNLRSQIIGNANGVFNSMPKSTTSTQTLPGSPIGSGFESLASTLAYLYGRGAFGKNSNTGAPIKNAQGANDLFGPHTYGAA